jgi:5-methylcytosine-specific restriction endonuclease McrA
VGAVSTRAPLIERNRWLWSARVEEIKRRDGFACRRCGAMYRLEVDHIVPRRLGGSDDPSNLRTLCHDCHLNRDLPAEMTRPGRGRRGTSLARTNAYSYGHPKAKVF